jgi:hypothetical protein
MIIKGLFFFAKVIYTNYNFYGNAKLLQHTFLYLNDNFNGGYLVYPEKKLAVKPKPGKLVIHSGNISHFVSSFDTDVARYYMTSFIFQKD